MPTAEDYKYWFIETAKNELCHDENGYYDYGYHERNAQYKDYLYDDKYFYSQYTPGNYTKYWYELGEFYEGGRGWQGQPWCGGFVTWCLVKSVGVSNAERLLRHYPFVYCPTIASKFEGARTNYPKNGDIILFWRNGNWNHTGIVVYVEDNGKNFWTVEGNTIRDSDYNKQAYCVAKKYHILDSETMTFITLDWASVDTTPKNDGSWARNICSQLHSYGYIDSYDYWSNYTAPVQIYAAFKLICRIYGYVSIAFNWSYEHEGMQYLRALMENNIINHTGIDPNSYKSMAGFENRLDSNFSRGECLNLIYKAEAYYTNGNDLKKYRTERYRNTSPANVACLNALCDIKAIDGSSGVQYWRNYEAPIARSHFMSLLVKTYENNYVFDGYKLPLFPFK